MITLMNADSLIFHPPITCSFAILKSIHSVTFGATTVDRSKNF